jgi:hypothetical protein
MSLSVDIARSERALKGVNSAQRYGLFRLALKRCLRAEVSFPSDARFQAFRVYLEVQTGAKNGEEGMEELAQIENPPIDPGLTTRLSASIRWRMGDQDRAIEDLRTFLQRGDAGSVRCTLGWMLACKKDDHGACEQFQESERTQGFPCIVHMRFALKAARAMRDRAGEARLREKTPPLLWLSFRVVGYRGRIPALAWLVPILVAMTASRWSVPVDLEVTGTALFLSLIVLAISWLAVPHWRFLAVFGCAIPATVGAYLLGLGSRPGQPIPPLGETVGWLLLAASLAVPYFLLRSSKKRAAVTQITA